MGVTLLGIVWIGLPLAHAVLLRDLPSHGAALLIDVLVGTFVTDTAAYATGRMFGSHKIAPSLSPNKTLEGLIGGFVIGTMGFWFAGLYQNWLSGADALIIGAAVAAIAPVGDLFESMLKRDLGKKDTGTIFGPHGGILDRLDAVLFTVVVGYYLAVRSSIEPRTPTLNSMRKVRHTRVDRVDRDPGARRDRDASDRAQVGRRSPPAARAGSRMSRRRASTGSQAIALADPEAAQRARGGNWGGRRAVPARRASAS